MREINDCGNAGVFHQPIRPYSGFQADDAIVISKTTAFSAIHTNDCHVDQAYKTVGSWAGTTDTQGKTDRLTALKIY